MTEMTQVPLTPDFVSSRIEKKREEEHARFIEEFRKEVVASVTYERVLAKMIESNGLHYCSFKIAYGSHYNDPILLAKCNAAIEEYVYSIIDREHYQFRFYFKTKDSLEIAIKMK